MSRKICVVITARPSYSRIKTALEAMRDHPDIELQLVVTASALLERYGDAIKVIREEGFTVDRQVYMILEGESPVTSAKSTGLGVTELATVFDDLKPDMVVTIADRFETMATAIAAAYMNIPLVHIQGGEVTGSIDEKVRHAITKLADIHLVSSQNSAERVIRMGEDPEKVIVTGCPSIDLARRARDAEPRAITDVLSGYGGVGADLDLDKGYIVVLQHPVTTEYQEAADQISHTLDAVRAGGYQALWLWPNVDAGSDATSKTIRSYRELYAMRHVHFYRNFKPLDFLSILMNSKGIVGNSSVAIRECSWLGVPAVNIGSRQSRRDRGRNVIDVAHDRDEIQAAIEKCISGVDRSGDEIYGDGTGGQQIAEALARVTPTFHKILSY